MSCDELNINRYLLNLSLCQFYYKFLMLVQYFVDVSNNDCNEDTFRVFDEREKENEKQ